jgi:ABC-type spermidine/putrescine transport system permease subunit I
MYTVSNGVITTVVVLPTITTALIALFALFTLYPDGRILNNTFYAWRGYTDQPLAPMGIIY